MQIANHCLLGVGRGRGQRRARRGLGRRDSARLERAGLSSVRAELDARCLVRAERVRLRRAPVRGRDSRRRAAAPRATLRRAGRGRAASARTPRRRRSPQASVSCVCVTGAIRVEFFFADVYISAVSSIRFRPWSVFCKSHGTRATRVND